MRKNVLVILAALLIFGCATGTGGSKNKNAVREEPDLYTRWPFLVGAAVPGRALNPSSEQYDLLRHFDVYVHENELKPDHILPQSGSGAYRWNNPDPLVNYALDNDKQLRGHTLIWHSQTSPWFFQGSGPEGRATKLELYNRMENHIKTVFEKYGGKIGWYDVCNEVVGDGGGPRSDSPYTKIMTDSGLGGMDRYEYVLKAFEWSRKYADANGGQNVKLYLNDYNIEYSGSKQSSFAELVEWLIANNAPIDGVGLQTHIRWDSPSVMSISGAIDRFAAIKRKDGVNLMTQITELDMSIFSGNEGSLTDIPQAFHALRFRIQKEKYRELFDMFEEKYNEGKLDMVLIWGLADPHSWLNNRPRGRTDYPLLFDEDYQPKDVYWALIEKRKTFK